MADANKRKAPPTGDGGQAKKKKGGNAGRWQTPHQRQKALTVQRGNIEVGDVGIWATCARGMEAKAARELQMLFEEHAEKMYGIKPPGHDSDEEDDAQDIEASIKKEISSLNPAGAEKAERVFVPVRLSLECLLFTKTRPPVEPVHFVRQICLEAKAAGPGAPGKTRYINRLTPVSHVVKASEKGLEDICRKVLPGTFVLKGQDGVPAEVADDTQFCTYGIRPTTRSHNTLSRDQVIKTIAGMIDDRHKVNLGAPDKIIMVEIYQSVCGMSVVEGSDWEQLKRYNLTEISNQGAKSRQPPRGDPKGGANSNEDPSKEGIAQSTATADDAA